MKPFFPNPYILAIGIALLTYLGLYGLKRIFTTRVSIFFRYTSNKWDDIIVLDQYMGEVEKIGLKTTRLRSLWILRSFTMSCQMITTSTWIFSKRFFSGFRRPWRRKKFHSPGLFRPFPWNPGSFICAPTSLRPRMTVSGNL